MKGPASCGQHVSTGSVERSTASPVATTSWQGPLFTVFGKTRGELRDLRNRLQLVEESRRAASGRGRTRGARPTPAHEASSSARSIRRREREDVDRDGMRRALDVLEEQRGPAGLDRAVGDLGDLEPRRDALADAHEIALVLESAQEGRQVAIRHAATLSLRPAADRHVGLDAADVEPARVVDRRLRVGGERAADLERQQRRDDRGPRASRRRAGRAEPSSILNASPIALPPRAAGRRPTA